LVTCKSWSHGWLNEGWATFMEYVFKQHDLGKDEADYYRYEDLKVYLDEDSEFRRPIVTNFYTDPAEVWDRHTYQKAGLVLQTLKAHLGEEDFWAGTKKYLDTHRGGSVETVDFQRGLESASGENLNKFFDQWFFKAGYPELKVGYEWDEKSKAAKISISQKQILDSKTSLFGIRTKIDFQLTDKTKVSFDLNIKDADQNFYFTLKSKPSYFVIDRGNHILKTIEWTVPLEISKELLAQDSDVVSKVWAMKALSKESSTEGIEILISSLKTDAFWGVRAEAALALGKTQMTSALNALLVALKEEKTGKVRAKICTALGNFKTDSAAAALSERLDKDLNIFVQGAAAVALGKTKHTTAFEKLKSALNKKSWRDYVRAQVFTGLKNLYEEKALPLFIEGARYGAPKWSRPNAVSGLSEVALERADVRETLVDFLNDPYLGVKRAAVTALVSRKDLSATSALEEIGFRAVDGHMKTMTLKAAEQIRKESSKPRELHELRERIDKIIEENKKLQERLAKVEASK
jgi:aminopeptidase N